MTVRPSRILPLFASIAATAFAVMLSGCVPQATNTEAPNALVANPRTLTLAPNGTDSSSVALNCGCNYKLTVTNYTGDTADIHYTTAVPLDEMTTPHKIAFTASPTATSGTHTAELDLFSPDDSGLKFYDTIRVTLVVP